MPTPEAAREWHEIVRLTGLAKVVAFDVEIPRVEVVGVRLERDDGTVVVDLVAAGPRSLAVLPFDDANRPLYDFAFAPLIVRDGTSVVLKATRQVSWMIWTAAMPQTDAEPRS